MEYRKLPTTDLRVSQVGENVGAGHLTIPAREMDEIDAILMEQG
jgi:aryl-alcohol dehydrogenase-like predicted oxidoreductase